MINNQSWPISKQIYQETQIQKDGNTVPSEDTGMNIDYAFKMPTYPADSTIQFPWIWHESKKDNQTVPHEAGNYTLTFTLRGIGYEATSNCTFEIRSK